MKLLGIDPSLTSTGLAHGESGIPVASNLTPPKGLDGVNRLIWFRSQFTDLLTTEKPEFVAIEGYAFGRINRAHHLGELGAVLRLALVDTRTPSMIVPPSCLKKFITGKGNAKKSEMMKDLYKRFEIDLSDEDQVDAAGLLLMARASRYAGATNQAQREALAKCEILVPFPAAPQVRHRSR